MLSIGVVFLLLATLNTALAHDCSSAADCSNVVQGTGLLAALLALILGVSAAAPKKWPTKKDKKEFKNCEGAGEWVSSTPEVGYTDLDLKHDYLNVKVTMQDDKSFVAEAELRSRLDPK